MRASLAPWLLVLAACGAGAQSAPVATLDAAGEPLRAQFDGAAGKVRAILLPAPT
jgi:hypothetical protein